jgi:hypothetical protein
VVGDDLPGHAAAPVHALQLQQQALAHVARAHAGRIEPLHHLQRRLDLFRGVIAHAGDLFQGRGKIAILVQVADDGFGGVADVFRKHADAQLGMQMIAQRDGRGQKVSKEGFSTDSEAGLL